MPALVPIEMPYWDDRTKRARTELQTAADAVVETPTADALGKLVEAKTEFGRALLALDKRRRPEAYRH